MLSKELLAIICCPRCRGDLVYDEKANTLTCKSCKTVYPVKNDIPILLPDPPKDAK